MWLLPLLLLTQDAPEHEKDDQPNAFDYEPAEFSSWSKGWHDKVYNEDSVKPDITLGEMLLMYFEWMSVHQVTAHALVLLSSACDHATGKHSFCAV